MTGRPRQFERAVKVSLPTDLIERLERTRAKLGDIRGYAATDAETLRAVIVAGLAALEGRT